jgi:hypothetical protein
LSFGEPPVSDAPALPSPVSEIRLPAGLSLELELDSEVDSQNSFVGDIVKAKVRRDAKKNGILHVPKGATVTGRIIRMERSAGRARGIILGLQFRSLEYRNRAAPFDAKLELVGPLLDRKPGGRYQSPRARGEPVWVGDSRTGDRPGLFLFQVDSDRVLLPRGFVMLWKTCAPEPPQRNPGD